MFANPTFAPSLENERSNLSIRMAVRRFTGLTNAFSKKWENHWATVALWFGFYSFSRVHETLRMTPAVAAGIKGASGACAMSWTLLGRMATAS
jgi:hypothetical protein